MENNKPKSNKGKYDYVELKKLAERIKELTLLEKKNNESEFRTTDSLGN